MALTLLQRISALHAVYELNRAQVLWFGQLVALFPGIMVHLTPETICDSDEMVCRIICLIWTFDMWLPIKTTL